MKKTKGFTLTEVLIAVFVLAIGLLGMAGMQSNSLRNNLSAYMRSQATMLAYDVIDRMRANRASAEAGEYLINFGAGPSNTTNCQNNSVTCDATTVSAFDVAQWKCMLGAWDSSSVCSSTFGMRGVLKNGDGEITRNGNVFTISVRYEERDGTTETLAVSTSL